MARARNIKPGFFKNADLVELPIEARLLFIGLWTLADRAGRLEDRPKQIKMELFPADAVDVDACLDGLQRWGFVKRYEINGRRLLQVVNFARHQNPHRDEKVSALPAPDGSIDEAPRKHGANTVQAPCSGGGSSVAIGLNPDSLIPDSRILIPEPKEQAHAVNPPPSARPPEPTPEGHTPTPAGLICRAMKAAGLAAVNPGDPRLLALIEQGATSAEFEGLAAEAAGKGKGFAWVLAVLAGRRQEAAAITLAPPIPDNSPPAVSPQIEATRRLLKSQELTPEQIQANRAAVADVRAKLQRIGR